MPWITSVRVADSQTVFSDDPKSNTKAERELIVSFAPGELKTSDEQLLRGYMRQFDSILKQAIAESLGGRTSETREPPAKPSTTPTKSQSTSDEAPVDESSDSDEEGHLKDKFGNIWPKQLTCKQCGNVVPVFPNKNDEACAICSGTNEKPHEGHFLKIDGSLGRVAKPKSG